MLMEGLYLMVVGMSFVLAFLSLVVLALNLLARFAPPAPRVVTQSQTSGVQSQAGQVETNQKKLAVISAAIHRYRNETK